jgi:uncharacterized protein YneF (UPF0154 family)
MYKLIEIEGRWVQVTYKTIEINGEPVITEDDIKIINQFNHIDSEQQIQQVNQQRREITLQNEHKKLQIKKSNS